MDCQDKIYSEEYEDYIVEYGSWSELVSEQYQTDCYQLADFRFAVVYLEGSAVDESRRNAELVIPRCFGLLSSTQTLEETGAARVRRQSQLELFGQGVMFGIVDTGIDYTIPSFLNADGTTRIYSIWDQSIPYVPNSGQEGGLPEELSYGTEYGREAINRALQSANPYDIVPSRDTEGHGTFMAGVACGNEDAAQEFSGIAPLAELVVVKCKAAKRNIRDYYGIDPDVPCFMENDIMLGIRYLARIAYRRRKPMVVCIGMGTSLGSHYRGGALGQIAQSYGDLRGFVVVAAGGNEGNESHHYHQEQLAARGETEVELRVDPAETGFTTELWCKAPGLCSVALISPGGEFSGRIYARVGERQMIRFLLEKTVVYIDYLLVSFESGDECIRLRFFGPEEGIWRFRVYNETDIPAQFDMWLPIREFINDGTYFLRPDPNTTLCDPSNNLQIITVSYYDGANRSVAAQASRGFNVRGEIAPDIAAPGINIYGPAPEPGNVAEDPDRPVRYVSRSGSSAAAAVTAGAAILLVEWGIVKGNDINMDTVGVQKYLIRGANRDGRRFPNEEWGYGTLDLYGAFEAIRPKP